MFFQIGLFSIGGGYAVIPGDPGAGGDPVGLGAGAGLYRYHHHLPDDPRAAGGQRLDLVGLQIARAAQGRWRPRRLRALGVCLSVGLYRFLARRRQSRWAQQVLEGLKAVSVG